MATLSIGEVSSGTLRNEDLASSFAWEIKMLARKEDHPGNKQAMLDLMAELDAIEDFDAEEASELVNEAIDMLNDYVPSHCYFGTLEGDGACFGVWPDMESVEELTKVSDPSELDDLDAEESEAVFVNDHGNVTLYARYALNGPIAWRVVWAIV